MKISIILSMPTELELLKDFELYDNHKIKLHSTGIDRDTNIPRFGLVPAAQATQKAIIMDKPDLVISVGTCGAINNGKIKIGDTIIANKCSYFDRILDDSFQSYGFGNFPCLFNDKFITNGVFIGKISSSNTFFTDKMQEINFNKLESIARDMESAAIADVCYSNNINCLVIRGVVSLLDENDVNKTMTNYNLGINAAKITFSNILKLI